MTYGLWLSAGGLQVNEYRQSLAANNMANVDTTGFKHDLAVIHERRIQSAAGTADGSFAHPLLDGLSGGAWVRPTYTSFAQGALEETGRALDAALVGKGFFTVADGDKTCYTRDGRFVTNNVGELVLAAGDGKFRVLDAGGAPVQIDPALGEVHIGDEGTVSQAGTVVARLGLADFDDPADLRKIGNSVFANVGGAEPAAVTPQVKGGFVERSTVNPISALTNMIEVTRAYELNARMISLQDETLGQAVTRIGNIG